jgi:hypothetical protein
MSKTNIVHPPEMLEADRVVRNFLHLYDTITKVADKIRYFEDGITRRDQNVCGELKKLYDSLTSSKKYGFWDHWTSIRRKEAESVLKIIQQEKLIEQCNTILAAASQSASPGPALAPAAAPTPTASAVSEDGATTFATIAQRAVDLDKQGPEHYEEAIPLYLQAARYLINRSSEEEKTIGEGYRGRAGILLGILEEQHRQRLEGNAGGGKRKRKYKRTRKIHKKTHKRSNHKKTHKLSKHKKSHKPKKTHKRKYKKTKKKLSKRR